MSDQDCLKYFGPVRKSHSWCLLFISYFTSGTVEIKSMSVTGVQSKDVLVICQ